MILYYYNRLHHNIQLHYRSVRIEIPQAMGIGLAARLWRLSVVDVNQPAGSKDHISLFLSLSISLGRLHFGSFSL